MRSNKDNLQAQRDQFPSELKLVIRLKDILERSPCTHDIYTDVSLLSIWGFVHCQRGLNMPIKEDEQHPDLGYVFREGISEMPKEVRQCFTNSALPKMCSPTVFGQIIDALNEYPARDAKLLTMYLHTILRDKYSKGKEYISNELSALLAKMIPLNSQSVLIQYPAAASVAPYFTDLGSLELVTSTADIELVLAHFLGGAAISLQSIEEIATDRSHDSDFVISSPPFRQKVGPNMKGLDKRSFLAKTIETVSRSFHNQAVILVTVAALTERSVSTSEVREELVRDNLLDAVVNLPKGAHLATSIPTALLVLRRDRLTDEPVRFIDFSEEPLTDVAIKQIVAGLRSKADDSLGALASRRELASNGYYLSVALYDKGNATAKLQSLPNTKSLSELVELVRSQSFKQVKTEDSNQVNLKFREAAISDIDDSGFLTDPSKEIEISSNQSRQANRQKLQEGDILLSVKGSVGRVALVPKDCDDDWLSGQIFMILRPKSGKVSSEYLFRFLKSDICQAYFSELAAGIEMQTLRKETVENLPVPFDEELISKVAKLNQSIEVHREIMRPLLAKVAEAEFQINNLFDMN
jgi:type I restriction enzyme M protein